MSLTKENLVIKKKFEEFMVPLTADEFNQLEENIVQQGCKDPLVVWTKKNESVLIDGHNRFKICSKHSIDFNITELTFKNEDEAIQWVINHQMGRRNLSSDQMSFYRGLKYLKMKKKIGGYDKVLGKGTTETTSEQLSKEFNVSPATVRRDANFAQGVELIGQSNPQLKLDILQGASKIPKKDIQFLASIKDHSPRFKNEADLYNKLENWKNEALNKIEENLESAKVEEVKLTEEEMFPDYEDRVKRIKSLVVSYMNTAIEKRNLDSIKKIREVLDQLESLISE
ncbi:MAG: hypothetical protein JXR03_18100 [Cyclobacteriaceae bacterium]